MRALLDVNVLIALHDREHVHHEHSAQWLETNIEHGWASCPLTQNGCLRVMGQPGYSNPLATRARLRTSAALARAFAAPAARTWLT